MIRELFERVFVVLYVLILVAGTSLIWLVAGPGWGVVAGLLCLAGAAVYIKAAQRWVPHPVDRMILG